VRGVSTRRGWLLGVVDAHGSVGWGEAAPWPGSGACAWSETRFAVEQALLDLRGGLKTFESPRAALVGSAAEAVCAVADGFKTLKVKVGVDLDAADALLAAIRQAVGPEIAIRIDANGCWSPDEAVAAVTLLSRHRLELVEQPCGSISGMAHVRQRVSVPIAADESVRTAAQLEQIIEQQAADLVVLKPMFTGGIQAAERLATRAGAAGLGVVVTHALESSVGRAGAVHLASSLAADGPAHGLSDRPSPFRPAPAVRRSDPTDIPNPVQSTALARPDHPVLTCGEETLTGRGLCERVARRAGVFRALRVSPGDIVGLIGPPSIDWVVSFHALGWLGATVAPLPHRAPAAELATALGVSGASAIVVAEGGAAPQQAAVRVITAVDDPALPLCPERFWPLAEPRLIVLTSGTTGPPRAVALTTAQLMTSAFGSAIRLGHDPADRWQCCLPLHHVGGLSILLRCAFYGTTVLLADLFDERATLVSMVPAQLAALLDTRGLLPFRASLRAILLGGAAAPAQLLARCRAIGAPVALTWGMTETASQVATRRPGDLSHGSGVGPPLPFARVHEVDGALEVRGPIAGGRVRTADRGAVDPLGRVHVDGRADDIIVSGGENIDPAEIERTLLAHPAVADVAVIGVPSGRWGRRPAAFLVQNNDERVPERPALAAWCRGRLARFKVPDTFIWIDELPRTALGKVMRKQLETL